MNKSQDTKCTTVVEVRLDVNYCIYERSYLQTLGRKVVSTDFRRTFTKIGEMAGVERGAVAKILLHTEAVNQKYYASVLNTSACSKFFSLIYSHIILLSF